MEQKTFKLKIDGKELEVKLMNLAEKANASAAVRLGETLVLAACVMSDKERENIDFFPLSVEYAERYYAAGKIRGSRYIKREGRPSDEAICNSRLIDRAIRPLFPKILKREVQVIATVLSWDGENDPDIPALIAASIVLAISNIPWQGPIGAIRIGEDKGEFVLNPNYEQREKSKLDIIFTGQEREDGEILINMIEGNFYEIEEERILKVFEFAKKTFKDICHFQKEIVQKLGKAKILLEQPIKEPELESEIREFLGDQLDKLLFPIQREEETREKKAERMELMNKLKEELVFFIEEKHPDQGKKAFVLSFFENEIGKLVRKNILEKEQRIDNRKLQEIREISCQVNLLPRTHGSGLFCRGQTKTLSILTLGAPDDVQLLEGMEIVGEKRFMHHYNFLPYSVGEVKPMRGPGRREIGHGILAEKALLPLIPCFEEFPYTIRIVSEILCSNGSTSMASVSSSSLALMDAGVPIKRPAAGISLGLVKKGKDWKILTDIQGPEDHYGDMDLKVAGTKKGLTSLQMDVKIEGISQKVLEQAFIQGKKARLQVLEAMAEVLEKPKPQLSPFAPRVHVLQINPEKIREVIGPGGKIINEIIADTGVSIDIQDSGKIFITSESGSSAEKAISWIKNITKEVKVGEVFEGKVIRILNFGALVEILPGTTGLIHISQLASSHVNKVQDVVKIGDLVPVKVISIDEQGRINLSLKQAKSK